MTNNENEDKKVKKLTLSTSGKLTLNRSAALPNKVTTVGKGANSTVVVEVKRGKILQGGISLNREAKVNQEDNNLNLRRLSALRRAQEDVEHDEESKISTLSQLTEINQVQESKEEEKELVFPEKKSAEEEKNEVKPTTEQVKTADSEVISKDPNKQGKPVEVKQPDSLEVVEEKKPEAPKHKLLEPKKLKKSDLFHMLDGDSDDIPTKTRSLASIKRARAKEKRKMDGSAVKEKLYREVILPEVITVGELASRMSERVADVIRELMKAGIMATTAQSIDADTAEIIATTLGHTVKRVQDSDVEKILEQLEDNPEDLKLRAPIVTVMGHVDHGKTSLLDALKSTDIASGEAGGITQHIGAYSVTMSDNRMITFIDTPGHEAFTEMRTRGAKVTDIVVLVVAADDGIMAQTVEAINHAKAAGVPIIVAINKIDKPDANIEKVKNELLIHELVPEDLGGDIITVPVSAKQRINLDKLEEAILLVAEMENLKSNPTAPASGVVIESRLDKGTGVIATVIVQRGTLNKGDLVMAGTTYGRVRTMRNDKGRTVNEAGPSYAVEIFGLDQPPSAGDIFNVVETDKQAKDITDYRLKKAKDSKVTASKTSLEELFMRAARDGTIKELPIIIKADVHGSIEAIIGSLNKIVSNEVKLKVLHTAVGAISESDISLAKATGAIILGFNVRSTVGAQKDSDASKVDIRYYSIIYNLVDDVKAIMSGMLAPIIREIYIGSVDIREVFNITKVGKVAGSYVTKGIIKRGAGVRLLRDEIVIHEGKLKTLKRFKDDVKEVREGFECGIAFENYDNIQVGDKVEVFEIVEEKQQL